LGNYEKSTENDEETSEDNKKTEGSRNDSRTTESPTRPETDLTLSTSDEIPTVTTLVTTSISDATPTEDD